MTEAQNAVRFANKVLDQPWCDPNDDLRVLARQFLSTLSVLEVTKQELSDLLKRKRSSDHMALTA